MRLSDFILLSEAEKKGAVLHKGVLIGKRGNDACKVFLFQLGNYYVEMVCNPKNKTVEEFRAFAHTSPLQPYLQFIPIDDLLN